MRSEEEPESDSEEGEEDPTWDALKVLRERTRVTRTNRDESISTLRESMSDDEIRDDFGIDLGEIER